MNKTGKREDRWQRVSDNLKRVDMDPSWLSCKDRMERLQDESFATQKTGAVEEVNEHLSNMIDIVLLYDSVSSNDLLKHAAKEKPELATRKAKGVQVGQASQQGLRPKNQFAKEVEGVIGGLHEKAEEFRGAIQEKGERDRNLGSKLDELIDTTRNTKQTMEKLMDFREFAQFRHRYSLFNEVLGKVLRYLRMVKTKMRVM
ncbi:hypothetical protein DFP73DRAFT_601868 [Morchella snyderi]|nr:hypothetical protein DFP73DRAFT_601868 [Morchella snyderi]